MYHETITVTKYNSYILLTIYYYQRLVNETYTNMISLYMHVYVCEDMCL